MEVKERNCLFLIFIALIILTIVKANPDVHQVDKKPKSDIDGLKHKFQHEHDLLNNKTNPVHRKQTQSDNCKNNDAYVDAFKNDDCDLITDGPICISGLNRVLMPLAVPKGLIGYWNFDDSHPIDYSGKNNHAKGKYQGGASYGGVGASALFTSGNYLEVPYNKDFVTNEFTITFWFYINQDFFSNKNTKLCPLLQRGNDNLSTKTFKRAPALYYDRKIKKLKFFVKTTDPEYTQGESVDSNAVLSPLRWYHISLVKNGYKISIYINGILDNEITTKQNLENNEDDPFYIGNVPWLKDQCDFPFLIDELRYFNLPLSEDYIQAEASPSLGVVEPNFIQFGCGNCKLKDAANACTEGYHLCTSIEIHTGAYQVARTLGWLKSDTHIWSLNAVKNPNKFAKLEGLALCCLDLK